MKEFNRFGMIISELQKEVELYEELYGSPNAVSVLTKVSEPVFLIIQRAMFFEIVTRLASVFDPAKKGKDSNLSFYHLLNRVDGKIKKETQELINQTIDLYQKTGIKKFRSKALAHLDLKQYLGKRALATDISYVNIATILRNLEVLIRTIPVEAGILAPGHAIYRDSKLQESNSGKALLAKLETAHNQALAGDAEKAARP